MILAVLFERTTLLAGMIVCELIALYFLLSILVEHYYVEKKRKRHEHEKIK